MTDARIRKRNINGNTAETSVVTLKRTGLDKREVNENRRKYGANVLTEQKKDGLIKSFFKSFNDPIIKILLAALLINAIVSLGHMNITETLGIATAILISTFVSTVSEYSSTKAFERLRKSSESECLVRRGGKNISIPAEEIVVGDIVFLNRGMTVPADGILIDGNVFCDQSALTGESIEKEKTAVSITAVTPGSIEWSPASKKEVFAGSGVCRGKGEMLALRVGDNTFLGEVAGSLQETSRPSPLKHRLGELAKSISFLGYIGAFMIAFAYLFNSFVIDSGMNFSVMAERLSDKGFLISELLRSVTVAVSVIVVAVPEGLPMMVTVVLSSNMKRMLRSGVLVRRLAGIETAGSLNILFTDKTGTLTSGKMKVKSIATVDVVTDSKNTLIKHKKLYDKIALAINSACSENVSSTEKALTAFVSDSEKIKPVKKLSFDSVRKYSAGVSGDSVYFAGACEKLLELCDKYYSEKEEILDFTPERIASVKNELNAMTKASCRVLCIAEGDKDTDMLSPEKLRFICLVAIRDPARKGVRESVREAKEAGIHVVMVTGDNPDTARAIAEEVSIYRDGDAVLEAGKLHAMSDDEVKQILPSVTVVARALPTDKIRLVKLSQEIGLVAGMTGDGINDAPALKAADVGFAMGSGTDIAKEAGDIVITDDSFSSITKAVLYGRTIFESIRKFIVFQLMMNLSAMGVSLIGPFIGIQAPVTVIQMLWVNIIMDTLGGLAFAGEPALKTYMKRKSLKRDTKIISRKMLTQIIITGAYTLALSIFFLKSSVVKSYFGGSETYFLTAFFAMFIFCGIFNSFNARTSSANVLSHLAGNKPFIFIMTLVASVQLLMIYFGGAVFRCTPLSFKHLLVTALIASSVIPADIIRKVIFKKMRRE